MYRKSGKNNKKTRRHNKKKSIKRLIGRNRKKIFGGVYDEALLREVDANFYNKTDMIINAISYIKRGDEFSSIRFNICDSDIEYPFALSQFSYDPDNYIEITLSELYFNTLSKSINYHIRKRLEFYFLIKKSFMGVTLSDNNILANFKLYFSNLSHPLENFPIRIYKPSFYLNYLLTLEKMNERFSIQHFDRCRDRLEFLCKDIIKFWATVHHPNYENNAGRETAQIDDLQVFSLFDTYYRSMKPHVVLDAEDIIPSEELSDDIPGFNPEDARGAVERDVTPSRLPSSAPSKTVPTTHSKPKKDVWYIIYDPKVQRKYFYNQESGVSQYEKPTNAIFNTWS